MNRDLHRRVVRLERERLNLTAPTGVLSDRPLTDDEAADYLDNWREHVREGAASVTGSVLYVLGPELTEAGWVLEHAQA